jgi:hypothetical protein
MPVEFVMRPVCTEDKSRILDFTAHTWGEDDGDYIQYVFDDWRIDPRGEFTAVELKRQVIGISKLTDQGENEWWLEGLRIAATDRQQGAGAALIRYQVDLARRLGGRVIRYMTGSENFGSQRVGARNGFQHILTYRSYATAANVDTSLPELLTRSDLPALKPWLDSPLMRHTQGLCRFGWSVRKLREHDLAHALGSARVYGRKDRSGRITAWAILRSPDDDEDESGGSRLKIDHLDGESESIVSLAKSMQALAASQHRETVTQGAADFGPLQQALAQAGYQPNPDQHGLWVLELKL